jgi:hypothetical protein
VAQCQHRYMQVNSFSVIKEPQSEPLPETADQKVSRGLPAQYASNSNRLGDLACAVDVKWPAPVATIK